MTAAAGRHRKDTRTGWPRVIVAAVLALLFAAVPGVAVAFWTTTDASNPGLATADTLPQGTRPAQPTTSTPNSTTVTLAFEQATTTLSHVPVTAYAVKRYPAAGGDAVLVTASCTISAGTVTCTETGVPEGRWRYTDTPAYGSRWVGTESTPSDAVVVDPTPPTVSLTNPGSPLQGTVTLTAMASDATSGVASVTVRYAVAGSTDWKDVCTDTTSPYSCSWDTTAVTDGAYDLTATATDRAGNVGTAVPVAYRTVDNQPPVVTLTPPANYIVSGTVILNATATDLGTGVTSVTIQRSPAGLNSWTDICTTTVAPYRCTWNTTSLASDYYDLRAVASDAVGHTGTSPVVADVMVDNTPPTVSMNSPGSTIRGTVLVSASASDDFSGVAWVEIEYAPAGTSTWTKICRVTAPPYSCYLDTTTMPDGSYDFVALAGDLAGNSATSTPVRNVKVDNTQSSVTMLDPGAYLRGTVTLSAAASSNAGVVSVRIQYAPSGTSSWVDVCTDTVSPYSCTWNTTTVPDGLYDFRAILLDGAGKTTTSAVVSGRRVDNTIVRGYDVQATNGGATVGRVESGDVLRFTYTDEMNLGSILAGWTGGPQPVVLRLRDGGLLGTGAAGDTVDILTTGTPSAPVNLGSVNTHGDLIKGGKTSLFTATMTASTTVVDGQTATVVTVTVGPLLSGGALRTEGAAAAMTWSPSGVATDLSGNPCSTAPVTELGALDKDF